MATNGLLLNEKNLLFLKQHEIFVSISIDGGRSFHDRNKKGRYQESIFDALLAKIALSLQMLQRDNLSALMTIAPELSHNLYSNFRFIVKLGFNKIHIDPVHGKKWNLSQKQYFVDNFVKIIKFVQNKIKASEYIYLIPLFSPIRRVFSGKTNRQEFCPFYADLEVYPMGEMAFSQFLLNSPVKKIRDLSVIADIKRDYLDKRYRKCYPSYGSDGCRNCLPEYYGNIKDPKMKGADLVRSRNKMVEIMIANISRSYYSNKACKNYLRKFVQQVNRLRLLKN